MLDEDEKLISGVLNSTVAENLYSDISPVIKETVTLVNFFVKTAQLFCIPFQYAAQLQKRLEKRFESAIEQVSEENRVIPPPSILIPITNHLSYLEDGILVTLFQNLLTKSLDKTRNSEAHPGFITIINQLSSDEASILVNLKNNQGSIKIVYYCRLQDGICTHLCKGANVLDVGKLICSNNIEMYIAHLNGLNLVNVGLPGSITLLESEPTRGRGIPLFQVNLTRFGNLFVSACLPD